MSYAKSQVTRARLLVSTARLLRTRGYAATGLRDILEDSGLPKGSLYHQFPGGKEELVAASVRASGELLVERLGRLVERTGDPVSAVREFCAAYEQQLPTTGYRAGCPLATVALETAADIESVREACAAAFDDLGALLAAALVAHGVEAEAAEDAATFTVASIEGALLLAKVRADTGPIRTVCDRLTRDLEELIETSGRSDEK